MSDDQKFLERSFQVSDFKTILNSVWSYHLQFLTIKSFVKAIKNFKGSEVQIWKDKML